MHCKPENDKDNLVLIILIVSSPASSAFLSMSNSTRVKMGRFFSVPAERCLMPILLQGPCFGSFPEGQCQGCGLSGENTQLATLRKHHHRDAEPGPARQEQLLQWDFGDWRPACAPCQQDTKQHLQTAESKCITELHVPTFYLLLHCSPRIY